MLVQNHMRVFFLLFFKYKSKFQQYNHIFIMMSIYPSDKMEKDGITLGSSERGYLPAVEPVKQQKKRKLITPIRFLIAVIIFCILAMASYKITLTFPATP